MTRTLALLLVTSSFLFGACAAQRPIVLQGELVPLPVDPEDALTDVKRTLDENFARVYFPFDSAELTEPSRKILRENAELLIEHPALQVRVEGHTDKAGSDEYNLALGDRRAVAVENYLVTLGVPATQLERVSMGEFDPAVPTGEAPEPKNRRAEFVVTVGDEAPVQGSRGS